MAAENALGAVCLLLRGTWHDGYEERGIRSKFQVARDLGAKQLAFSG